MPCRDKLILKIISKWNIRPILPWVLCMALKFEFSASKLLSIWVVCLKWSTCWKDLNSKKSSIWLFMLKIRISYCKFNNWSNSNSNVSKGWPALIEKFEVEFSPGKFWRISANKAILSFSFNLCPFSNSIDNTLVTVLRNGVKLFLRASNCPGSSCGKNVSQSHSFNFEQHVLDFSTFKILENFQFSFWLKK